MSRRRIVVGLSGGVDSAVAALLLKQDGHDVRAVFMKNWEEDDTDAQCSSEEDLRAARSVCAHLDLPLTTVNLSADYWEHVFEDLLAGCRAGVTPNPDVLCNSEIKFKAFLDHALAAGAEAIATGHYARLGTHEGHVALLQAEDTDKDQTYFLYRVAPEALSRSLFPLGHLTKPQVRTLALDAGLPNHDRPDSTGLCFIGERRFRPFLQRFLARTPGEIQTPDGRVVGQHQGLAFYTHGQRSGLGIGGPGEPWYVSGKDMARNILQVVQGASHPALFRDHFILDQPRWIDPEQQTDGLECTVRLRHRQPLRACHFRSGEANVAQITLTTPERAVTPGQHAVFYLRDRCLGGGIIRL